MSLVVKQDPRRDLVLSIVIPCYNEPNILDTLNSLDSCAFNQGSVEVFVVLNDHISDSSDVHAQNKRTKCQIKSFAFSKRNLNFHLIDFTQNSDNEHGVGLSRKIGLDLACERILSVNPQGVLVCLDADTTVHENYLNEIYNHFKKNNLTNATSIYFEHNLSGKRHPKETYHSIVLYELFLRYYKLGLAYAKLPYAYHTVGSAMAVRASAYLKVGGMNKRKAGEDFYFFQKFIKHGKVSELMSTCVFPSSRSSDRVPFGTGKAVLHINDLQEQKEAYCVYDPSVFLALKSISKKVNELGKKFKINVLNKEVSRFFFFIKAEEKIEKINQNAKTDAQFIRQFYMFFDAFKCMKFAHYYRDHVQGNVPIAQAVDVLLDYLQIPTPERYTNKDRLIKLRAIEKSQINFF